MELFDIYKSIDLEVVEEKKCFEFDKKGNKYLNGTIPS